MRRLFGRLGLAAKVTLSFALVIVLAVAIVGYLANRATTTAFQHYVGLGYETRAVDLAEELATYYETNSSWDNVLQLLLSYLPGGQGRGRGLGARAVEFVLLNANGVVVADTAGDRVGQLISPNSAALSLPIEVSDRQVGALLVMSPTGSGALMGLQEEAFLGQVNQALLLGGALAIVLAILLGIWLARELAWPIRALSDAAHRIAATDFTSRVQVRTEDEIGALSQTFNQMAEALERAERSRRQMTADIAHELRTPVTVIQGHLEAMQDGVFEPTTENLQVLLDETSMLSRLIEDLRDLSLAESGRLDLSLQETDPASQLALAVRRFQSLALERGVELRLDAPLALPMLWLDPGRIQQVLANLLGNALRHTPPGGNVTVAGRWVEEGASASLPVELSWTPLPPFLVVSVTDTGEGIAPEHLASVFERFYRVDDSRSRESGGSGLGLSIARQLVRAHGGEMGVASTVGVGTTFAFVLPWRASPVGYPASSEQGASSLGASGVANANK